MSDNIGEYISGLFAREDALLVALRESADREGLPPIAISADAGRLMQVLLAAIGARRVLEVGTLGGYSGIWIARALPANGELVTIEIDQKHAAFARDQFEKAKVDAKIHIIIGRALDVLPSMDGEKFDAMFIDADKEPMPRYFDWGMRLVRPGGLIIADNALRGGKVLDAQTTDAATLGVQEFNRKLATDPRIDGIIVPTHDGVAVGVVKGA